MLIASQFGKTLVFCFRVAPELHGEAIFAISGDQTPRLGHIDVVVSDIYIYIYLSLSTFLLEIICLHV